MTLKGQLDVAQEAYTLAACKAVSSQCYSVIGVFARVCVRFNAIAYATIVKTVAI